MKKFFLFAFLFFAFIVFYSSYFIVNEIEQVIITRFGKPIGKPIAQSGLYFKTPIIDKANYFEKRILEWDGDPNQIPTKDKKNIAVDITARWKIIDPLKFFQTVGNEEGAQTRLDDIIDSAVRNEISNHNLIEIVRNSDRILNVIKKEYELEGLGITQDQEEIADQIKVGRDKLTREILAAATASVEKFGIKLIDVRIKGLMYSQAVLQTVYQRMISQYGIKAQNLRSEGDKKKSKIEGEQELEVKTISSGAFKKSQEIRGQADAEAAKIYANALNVDAEFYHFQRSLETYKNMIGANTTIILGSDSELFKVLKSAGKSGSGL
jgi:membrane protease subunit HflC